MPIDRPLKRTIRRFTDGSYSNSGNWKYLLHPMYVKNPQHYIRSFLLIQEDLQKLFKYVEPSDQNKDTISLKIHELLVRTCIEIEANFTAILLENEYSNTENMNMKKDYCLIDYSHKLSSYRIKLPIWMGQHHTRVPFKKWKNKNIENWHVLSWYQTYNKSKHERYSSYSKAKFEVLIDAVCGLVALLSAQFLDESYSPASKSQGISGNYSYDYDPKLKTAIGGYFRVQYPDDWENDDLYDFKWCEIEQLDNIFNSIDYDQIKKKRTF
jgi:hypothetical protein